MKDLDAIVNGYEKDIIQATCDLVEIPSMAEDPEGSMPFGREDYRAMEYTMDLCGRLGLTARNLDGYIGYATYGQGPEMVGVLVHMDVVPGGTGWDTPPFVATIKDGAIYGRGTCDDKGPLVAALYALRSVMDSGAAFKKEVRVIFGCDEESGYMRDTHHYKELGERDPDFVFSPDSQYPVINAEKTILHMKYNMKPVQPSGEGIRILSIQAGERINVVPAECKAVLSAPDADKAVEELKRKAAELDIQITISHTGGNIELTTHGVMAHASTPEDGKNAIAGMLTLLSQMQLAGGTNESAVKLFARHIGMSSYGEHMGLDVKDEPTGRLTMNMGIIQADEKGFELRVDHRIPVLYPSEDVLARLQEAFGSACIIATLVHTKGIYVPADNPSVKKLLEVYEAQTGLKGYAFGVGGGTYAREFKCGVSFGPYLPGEAHLAHQANEHIHIDRLMMNARIMAHAIKELACE